jgi:hypothetical protein
VSNSVDDFERARYHLPNRRRREQLERGVQDLIAMRWRLVDALARALLDRGRLSAAEIDAVVWDA